MFMGGGWTTLLGFAAAALFFCGWSSFRLSVPVGGADNLRLCMPGGGAIQVRESGAKVLTLRRTATGMFDPHV